MNDHSEGTKETLLNLANNTYYDLKEKLIHLRENKDPAQAESVNEEVAKLMVELYKYHLDLYKISGEVFNADDGWSDGFSNRLENFIKFRRTLMTEASKKLELVDPSRSDGLKKEPAQAKLYGNHWLPFISRSFKQKDQSLFNYLVMEDLQDDLSYEHIMARFVEGRETFFLYSSQFLDMDRGGRYQEMQSHMAFHSHFRNKPKSIIDDRSSQVMIAADGRVSFNLK